MKKWMVRFCIGFGLIVSLIVLVVMFGLLRLQLSWTDLLRPKAMDAMVYRDLTYKQVDDRDLKLDLYMPRRIVFKKAPVLFLYHGGGWERGSKGLDQFGQIEMLTQMGFAIVSVEYRLTDAKTTFPAHLEDCADAIRFIASHATHYGLDVNRFCVMGASAGGHLSLLLAFVGEKYAQDPTHINEPLPIKCVISLCAPTDLPNLAGPTPRSTQDLQQTVERFLGASIDEQPDLYKMASPIYHVRRNAPPVLIAHGTADTTILIEQSDRFYEAARDSRMKITYIRVENADHEFQPKGGQMDPSIEHLFIRIVIFVIWNLLLR